jgi:outer membrane protein W
MASAGGVDVPLQATMVDLGFAYKFVKNGRKLTPYVGAGGTYYLLDTKNSRQGRLQDEYGWYGLLGLDLPIGPRWVIYAEGMWRDAKAALKGDDLGFGSTVDQSINLNGPQVNLGIAFSW